MNNNNVLAFSSTSGLLEDARKSRKERQQAKKDKTKNKLAEFMNADVSDSEVGIIPEGYNGITYLTIFLFLPEIVGIAFIFFYIGDGNLATLQATNIDYLLTWIVGYEIVVALVLLLAFQKAMVAIFSKST